MGDIVLHHSLMLVVNQDDYLNVQISLEVDYELTNDTDKRFQEAMAPGSNTLSLIHG